MTAQEIAWCPNPECGEPFCDDNIADVFEATPEDQDEPDYEGFQAECSLVHGGCGYRGPFRPTRSDAIAAHNALCRGRVVAWTDKPPEVAGDRSVAPIRRTAATREAVEKAGRMTLMLRAQLVREGAPFQDRDVLRALLSDPAIRALYEEEG